MTRDAKTGLDVLSLDECRDLLARAPIGRVAVHLAEHPPVIFPVNYFYDESDIVFRTDATSILHRADRHTVAFEIDGIDRLYHLGWSVLVTGILQEITDGSHLIELASTPLGPWAPGPKPHWMGISTDTITGRSIPIPDNTEPARPQTGTLR